MARQETIQVIIDHKSADDSLRSLQSAANTLRQTLGNMNVGNTANAFQAQAQAANQASQALINNTNAQTANTNAQTAATNRITAETNAINAQTNAVSANTNMMTANTNANAASTNATTANTNAQTANTNATTANTNATAAQLNAVASLGNAVIAATNATTANTNAVTANTNATAANITQQAAQVNLNIQLMQQMMTQMRLNNQLTNAQRRLGQQIQNLNAQYPISIQYMRQLIRAQNGLENATVQATGMIRMGANAFQTYRASVTEAGGAVHNYRISVNTATGEVYRLDQGIRTSNVSLRDMSSILRSLRTVIGFTGIAQSLRYAFSEMKNMSDAMAEYRKVTGATVDDMEALREKAYDVAKAYGESASDVISSAANMARAGYQKNSMAMAELATKTKLVGDMTQDAADKFLIAVDAAYKYNGSVQALSAVLDAANALDNQYATTIEKISDGMTLVASLASTAHVPIEQLMAALGTMTAVTQRSGAETARGLRSIILHVMGDTTSEIEEGVTATEEGVKSLTEALIKYGDESIKAAAKAGKIINPMEAIVALQKAWKENQITEQDLYGIIKDEAGQRYYNVFSALIMNPEMYNSMLQSIADSVGSAQNEIDILMDSWSKKLEKLKTTWTELVNKSITEGFIKDLIDGGTAALEFAGSLENLAIMAGGAYEAIRSLTVGLNNLRAGTAFGGFNIGMGLLGLAVAGIGYWKASYEENIRKMQEAASEAMKNATEKSGTFASLYSIQERYSEIAKDGIQQEQGELDELKTLQGELNSLVGDQATAIDIVNGKYDDQIEKIRQLTKEQKEKAIEEYKSVIRWNLASFSQEDLNGPLNFGLGGLLTGGYSPAGLSFSTQAITNLEDYVGLTDYFKFIGNGLYFRKPTDEAELLAFYKETKDFYNLITNNDGYASNEVILKFKELLDNVGKYAEPIKTAREGIDNLLNDIAEIDEETSEEKAKEGIDGVTESVNHLANSIEAATKAKEKFDDAMKTTKADAFKDYMEAFSTFKTEMDAGRVNSTAMYAAAQMMLGADAYNATGGTYQGVMAAMNRRGSAGSVMEAYNILNTQYADKNGNVVEGYGVYELLRKSGLFTESQLVDKNGNYYIPELTSAQISEISSAYGGILEEVIINALNALDQYDLYGEATADKVKSKRAENEEEKNKETEAAAAATESVKNLGTAADETTTSAENLTLAMKEAAEAAKGYAERQKELAGADAKTGVDLPTLQEMLKIDAQSIAGTGVRTGMQMGAAPSYAELMARYVNGKSTSGAAPEIAAGGIAAGIAAGAGGTSGTGNALIELAAEIAAEKITTGADSGIGKGKTTASVNPTIAGAGAAGGTVSSGLAGAVVDVAANKLLTDTGITLQSGGAKLNGNTTIAGAAGGTGSPDLAAAAVDVAAEKLIENSSETLEHGGAQAESGKHGGNLLLALIEQATGVDLGAAETERQEIPKYDENDFHDVKPEDYAGSVKEEVKEAVSEGVQEGVTEGLQYTQDENVWQTIPLAETKETVESAYDTLRAFSDELAKNGGQIEQAAQDMGLSIDDILRAYSEYQESIGEPLSPDLNKDEALEKLQELMTEWNGMEFVFGMNADPKPAIKTADETVKTINGKTAHITIVGDLSGIGGVKLAGGTKEHAGGPALVNDGGGAELLVDSGMAFIANRGKPAIVNLNKGAKVFTASETRQILGGVPAYAIGTQASVFSTYDGGVSSGAKSNLPVIETGSITGTSPNDIKPVEDGKKKKTSNSEKKQAEFSELKDLIKYIIERVGMALDEQIEIIDKQIDELKAQRAAQEQQNELEEKQKQVAEAQKDLMDALNERTVRYLGEDGKWHWMADAGNVQSARENLQKAQESLADYEDDLAFNARIEALEAQKTALKDEYNQITKAWSDIQYAVSTPTGDLDKMINEIIKTGSATDKKGAETVRNLLITKLLQGGIFSGNYAEALDSIAKATAGNPIMPGESTATLASLIAMTAATGTGDEITSALRATATPNGGISGYAGVTDTGTQINYNYFLNGIQIGADKANEPLSAVLRDLTVQTNAGAL